MAFKPLVLDERKIRLIKSGTASSTTIAKYDALDISSGYLQRATSGTTEVKYVANQAVTTAGGANEDIEVIVTDGVLFEADTNADPVIATDRFVKADLTDHETLNESASSNDVFYVEDANLPLTDQKVVGYFIQKTS